MRFPGNVRGLLRRLTRETATTTLAVAIGLGGWLFGPAEPAAASVPGVASWRVDSIAGQPLPDPQRATPAQVARFFAGLDEGQRQALAARYPQIVGNLDGAPPQLRVEVNTQRSGDGRQLLEYDPRGDGRIAEVTGDLSTADRIAVIVPGVDSRLDNFEHAERIRRAPAWQARQLYGEAKLADPASRVAVIAWLGYDPPEGVGRDAIREERARSGAKALARFVAGLAVYRPAAALTVIGHSYGSVVTGLAARSLSPSVRDIAVIGSPGMGVDRAVDLGTRARVWAGSARSDWTRSVPGIRLLGVGHGRLPVEAAFGARPLPAGNVIDHDGYFVPGADTLRGLAGIVLGQPAADRT